ncbi:MAG: hypothetical protein H6734_27500 [Alphaproteobacteria bacterium]|nr:hypothetical protein [Alphaproteobacteria bacterium]MCB9688148.1 hypothetical protein [Alphaproteobacteria bacterium]
MRRVLPLVLLGACTPLLPEELDGVTVTEARLEGVGSAGIQLIAGGFSGTATLKATTPDERVLTIPVDLSTGAAGLLVEFSVTAGGDVELAIPPGGVAGDELFGTYRGSREALVLLVGPVGVHLENDAGVRIDQTQLGFGIGISVSYSWMSMSLHVDEPTLGTGDTGFTPPPESGETPPETGTTTDETGWTTTPWHSASTTETGHTG